ncbi:hypothetical protein C8R47DRAFT_1068434 [Mycena vitilis]|nr:hypothetical protein C8R47DRAFT_1068434 [Mycena vitilis]
MDPELAKVINRDGNLPPTDLQSGDIRRMLAAGAAEVARLDATILAVSLVISELESQRSRRRETMVATRMTSLTFSIAVEKRQLSLAKSHRAGDPSAIPPHFLWDDIRLVSKGMAGLPYIQRLLARSENLPVSARLAVYGGTVAKPAPVVGFFLGLHSRLKTIALDITSSDLLPHRDPCHTEVFPLTSLEVTFTDSLSADVGYDLSTFSKAPNLGRLAELALQLPITLHDARLSLTLCQRLQTVRISECTGPPDSVGHAVQLPVLRTLDFHIEDEEDDAATAFFGAFSFPGLQNLEIRADVFSPTILPDLLDRSQFKLATLVLREFYILSSDLLALLRRLPTLREVSLRFCGIDVRFPAMFTANPASASYRLTLPYLERLCLSDYADTFEGTAARHG